MTVSRRIANLFRVVFADTVADLAGLIAEVRSQSEPLTPGRPANDGSIGREPISGRRPPAVAPIRVPAGRRGRPG